MQIRVLGTVGVDSATRFEVHGGQVRSVLAFLTIERARPVTREELADLLWGDELPPNWKAALRGLVAKVRAALNAAGIGGAGIIANSYGCYRLNLPPTVGIDLEEATDALLEVERSTAEETALAKARMALDVLQQPFLSGQEGAWIDQKRRELDQLVLRALRAYSSALSATSRHGESIAVAEAAIARDPWGEAGYRLLMTVQLAAGDRHAAIAAFDRCRALLRDDFGIRPSAETEGLYLTVLGGAPDAPDAPNEGEVARDGEVGHDGDRAAAGNAPLKGRGRRPLGAAASWANPADAGRFVGREAEFAVLLAAWRRSRIGERRVVMIGGEAGAGKTRLAGEFASEVASTGGVVLYGRAREEVAAPFEPVVEALATFVERQGPDELATALGAYPGDLRCILPALDGVLGLPPMLSSDPATTRLRVFQAVDSWLTAASAGQPVVLVLDDLQWADASTVALLRYLIKGGERAAVLLLGLYRGEEVDREHPLSAVVSACEQRPETQHLLLHGLAEDALARLVTDAIATSAAPPPSLVRSVAERTGGNPFFARELLRETALRVAGAPPSLIPGVPPEAPRSVSALVAERLRRLPDPVVQTLQIAAVIGREFEFPTLAATSALAEDELLVALEHSVAARLISESRADLWRFNHDLVRESIYHSLSQSRRARLHVAIAHQLERADPEQYVLLAHHYAQVPSEASRAIHYFQASAERSRQARAYDQAAAEYADAVALCRRSPRSERDLCMLTLELGRAQRDAGLAAHRNTLLDACALARQLSLEEVEAAAAAAASRPLYAAIGSTDAGILTAIEHALEALPHGDSVVRARLLIASACESVSGGSWVRRAQVADEALAMARRLGDVELLADVLEGHRQATWVPETARRRREGAVELLDLAGRLGDPVRQVRAEMGAFMTHLEVGDPGVAQRHLEKAQSAVADLGQPTLRWHVGLHRVTMAVLRGRLADAEHLSHALATDAAALESAEAIQNTFYQWVILRALQGQLVADEVARVEAAAEGTWATGTWTALLAWCQVTLGATLAARRTLRRSAFDRFAAVPYNASWLLAMALYSEVAHAVGDVGVARVLYDLMLAHRHLFVVTGPVCMGSVERYLGLCAATAGDVARADAHLRRALDLHRHFGCGTWLERTTTDLVRLSTA